MWQYASDGDGFVVLDILSKIAQAFSEVTMSVLLIFMAQGWTILYLDLEIDSNLEIFIPTMAIVVMIHVIVSALTFIDIDATHKYHDFSGVQGWVLFATKVALWTYFAY